MFTSSCVLFSVELLLCPAHNIHLLITTGVFSRAIVSLFSPGAHNSKIHHQAVLNVDMYKYYQTGSVKTAVWSENTSGSLEVFVAVITQPAAFRDVMQCDKDQQCIHLQALRAEDGGSRWYLFTELRVQEVTSKRQVMFIKIRDY